jgi:hypothetical protein
MISLITTCNNTDFLLQTAMSVKGQFFNDFEWILLIDGMENIDNNILNWIDENIAQVRIIIKEHQGRNKALIDAHNLVNYPYIGWLDSDDLLHPLCLKECFNAIHKKQSLVYTNCYYINKDSKINSHVQNLAYSKRNLLLYFCAFHFRLFTRDLYELVKGIDSTFKYSMDYELTLRMGKITEFYHIKEPLYYYRIHGDNISHRHTLKQKEYHVKAYEKHLDLLSSF